ncbi:MAG: radical SAM family heme chaperone HemW [Limisphaerales bacterium]
MFPPSLYVHVPFCAQKCGYCAFYSAPAEGELVGRYVAALTRELQLIAPHFGRLAPATIFFGGGTPSLLNLSHWRTIFRALELHGLLGAAEFTVECNPATVSADKARLFRDHGVNRVSMGVQSLDDALLDRLGRVHSRDMVFRSYDTLRAAGFTSVNLDLMFAIPTQTLDVWRATLREALAFNAEHLSSYEVIYEDDTPLYEQLKAGRFAVDEDLACDMYDVLLEEASAAGLRQYEVANFARHDGAANDELPSFACRHNVGYWRGRPSVACGPSATGFRPPLRTKNLANTRVYCDRLERGERAVEWREELEPLACAGEMAAFGLRMNAGWPWEEFRQNTGFDLRAGWAAEIEALVARGWGEADSHGFRLTATGLRFADAAGMDFLRPGGPRRRRPAPAAVPA